MGAIAADTWLGLGAGMVIKRRRIPMHGNKIHPDSFREIEKSLDDIDREFRVTHHAEIQDDWEYLLVHMQVDRSISIERMHQLRDTIRAAIESLLPSRVDKPTWSIGIEADGQVVEAVIGGQTAG